MYISVYLSIYTHFPGALAVKNLPASAGDARDTGSIRESGRSPGEGNGNLHPNSREHPMDRGAWWATVLGVAKSQTRLSMRVRVYLNTQTLFKISPADSYRSP